VCLSIVIIALCVFVRPGLEHIRIIRDGTPNQYMVLLKFRDEVSHFLVFCPNFHLCYISIYSHCILFAGNNWFLFDADLSILITGIHTPTHAHIF